MTDTKQIKSLFANKGDLEAAKKRIAELEAQLATGKASPLSAQLATAQATITRLQNEITVLKSRPLAVAPKASTAPAKVSPAPAKASTTAATSDTYEWKPAPKPVLSRDKFSALSPADKSAFIRDGGKLID